MNTDAVFHQESGETKAVLFGPADQVAILLTALPDGLVLSAYVDRDGQDPEGFQLMLRGDNIQASFDVMGGELIDVGSMLDILTHKES